MKCCPPSSASRSEAPNSTRGSRPHAPAGASPGRQQAALATAGGASPYLERGVWGRCRPACLLPSSQPSCWLADWVSDPRSCQAASSGDADTHTPTGAKALGGRGWLPALSQYVVSFPDKYSKQALWPHHWEYQNISTESPRPETRRKARRRRQGLTRVSSTVHSHQWAEAQVDSRVRAHAQSCPTLHDPMNYSPPGSSVHGTFQARILECVAISHSRGSS